MTLAASPPGAPPTEPAAAPAPPPVAVPHRLSHRVEGLGCPNCGGALEVDTGLRVVVCGYCGTTLLVLSEIGVRRYAVEPRTDAGAVRQTVRRWLGSGLDKDRRLRRDARVAEAFLCFLPFYRVEADIVGVALGTEERRRTVGSGKSRRVEVYEVDVERTVTRSFDTTYPGVNVAEWGVRRVNLAGDPLVAFDADALRRAGMLFEPTGSEREMLESAVASFRQVADPASGLKRVHFRHQSALRERLSVVYYPIWVVRYTFRERSYQVLVDGEDGSLVYGKAPGNDLYRALALVAAQAAAAFVGTTLLQVWGGSEGSLLLALGITVALLAWGWRRFRHGGVVEEGSGIGEDPAFRPSWRQALRRSPDELLGELASGRLPGLGR